jgi:hypothetical protein
MEIMDIKERFVVQEEVTTFRDLLDAQPALRSELERKGVIILPSHGRDDAFYAGSLDTLDYLNENGLEADIYATDEAYKELGLHGADIWLGTFIVKNILIPVFCSVISAYIYDKLKAKGDDKVSLKFIVEKKDGNTSSVSYDGKVENLQTAIDAVKSISNDD